MSAATFGPLVSGAYTFAAREEQWTHDRSEGGERRGPSYALELPPQPTWNWGSGVAVLRQGFASDEAWGVDADLSAPRGAMAPEEARLFAHALLAAANLAEQLEHAGEDVPR